MKGLAPDPASCRVVCPRGPLHYGFRGFRVLKSYNRPYRRVDSQGEAERRSPQGPAPDPSTLGKGEGGLLHGGGLHLLRAGVDSGRAGMASGPETRRKDQELLQRLDLHVTTLTDNFVNLVKAARINDEEDRREQGKRVPGEMPEVLAEKIVFGGKGLLELVAEIKRKAIVSDYAALNRIKAERAAAFDNEVVTVETELLNIKAEVVCSLRQLEEHYYASKYKPELSFNAFKDPEMQPLYDVALNLPAVS